MADLNFVAVGASIVVAFVISSAWYAVFGNQMALLRGGGDLKRDQSHRGRSRSNCSGAPWLRSRLPGESVVWV